MLCEKQKPIGDIINGTAFSCDKLYHWPTRTINNKGSEERELHSVCCSGNDGLLFYFYVSLVLFVLIFARTVFFSFCFSSESFFL